MSHNKELLEKWAPVLDHGDLPKITDPTKRLVTAQVMENTEQELKRGGAASATRGFLGEDYAGHVNQTGQVANYDPIMITMLRRSMPNLMAYDVAGVQPMTGPTGLIFALRSNYVDSSNNEVLTEAFYDEADTAFSGIGTHANTTFNANTTNTGSGMPTANAELLGFPGEQDFNEMAMTIEQVSVTARSRALKAQWTTETAQDLMAIHGLDAETEIANMLQTELLAEINRELVRTIVRVAKVGAQDGTANAGVFDLDVDSNGRWSEEKFKGLVFQIEREANAIARETRRGKGNIIICSGDVASALASARVINPPAGDLSIDEANSTFAGVLNGRYRVYVDPYAGSNYLVVGYKGSSAMDAGLYYAPYTPMVMARAIDSGSFQPKIAFKTRYGMVANPFATGKRDGANTVGDGALTNNANVYYRKIAVANLL